jgi:hypothetical protein
MAVDMNKINSLLAQVQPRASLTPSASAVSTMPIAPEYEAYKAKKWNDDAGSEYGMQWTKGVKTHQLFDAEQESKANQALQEYQNKMSAYNTQLNQFNNDRTFSANQEKEQADRLAQQYADQGLIAPTSTSDITPQIRKFGELYTQAATSGDMQAAESYHNAALDLARKAGWIQEGVTPSSVNSLPNMTSAGLPTYKRQSEESAAANSVEGQDWYMPLARAQAEATLANTQRSANAPYGGSSGGGGSGSTPKPVSLYDQAKAAAYNDPRLYTGKEGTPEGTWSLEDLISAYMMTYGGQQQPQQASGGGDVTSSMIQQARANGYSDVEIRQGLIEDGLDPAQYGL